MVCQGLPGTERLRKLVLDGIPVEGLTGSGESPDGGVRQGFSDPHRASHSLPVGLIAFQKVFLEVSKEQAVMEFLCFYIWLDVDFLDFQEKA